MDSRRSYTYTSSQRQLLHYGVIVIMLWMCYFVLTHFTHFHYTRKILKSEFTTTASAAAAAVQEPSNFIPEDGAPLLQNFSFPDPCSESQNPFFEPQRGSDRQQQQLMHRDYLREVHHFAFGRAWGLGRDIFDYLLYRGLQPSDVILDFGCGALRNGIWLIPYVEVGHYYGIEYNTFMFLAGKVYEIPLHGLQNKQPHLLNNLDGEPSLDKFESADGGSDLVKFDKILAFAVLIHLNNTPLLKRRILMAFVQQLRPAGTIFLSHSLPFSLETLKQEFQLKVVRQERQPCRWSQSTNVWFELQKITASDDSA